MSQNAVVAKLSKRGYILEYLEFYIEPTEERSLGLGSGQEWSMWGARKQELFCAFHLLGQNACRSLVISASLCSRCQFPRRSICLPLLALPVQPWYQSKGLFLVFSCFLLLLLFVKFDIVHWVEEILNPGEQCIFGLWLKARLWQWKEKQDFSLVCGQKQ